eukprot:scaffold190018_cov18-Tisochrysis_lutea.AAC.2
MPPHCPVSLICHVERSGAIVSGAVMLLMVLALMPYELSVERLLIGWAAAAHRRAVDALAPSSTAACFDVASVRPGQHLGQAVVLEHGSEPRP